MNIRDRVKMGAPDWIDAIDELLVLDNNSDPWLIGMASDKSREMLVLVLVKRGDAPVSYTSGTSAIDMASLIEFHRDDVDSGEKQFGTTEVAEKLGVPRDTVLSLVKRKPELRPAKVGKSFSWKQSDIDRIVPHLRAFS